MDDCGFLPRNWGIGERGMEQGLVLYTTRPIPQIIDIYYDKYWESIDEQNFVNDWDRPDGTFEEEW